MPIDLSKLNSSQIQNNLAENSLKIGVEIMFFNLENFF